MRPTLGLSLFLLFENFGNWLVFISVLTLAGYELNAGPTEVALVTVSMLLPQAVFGRLFQRLAHRWPSRSLLAGVTVSQISFALLLLVAQSTISLCAILLARSFVQGFFQPAFAAVSSRHPSARLASLVSIIRSVTRIVAPAVGGVIGSAYGESAVFTVSALMAALAVPFVLALPKDRPDTSPGPEEKKEGSRGTAGIWLILVLPILFVNGIASLFSNLIPFAFSFYELPKTLLALAISCSAAGGLLANLVILRFPMATEDYPTRRIWLAWSANATLFLLLAGVLPTAAWAFYAVPVIFGLLSGARALFEVAITGFIFAQSRDRAITLASQKQSLMAITGIGATFTGASAMEVISPALTLMALSAVALAASLAWLFVMFSSATTAEAPPARTQPTGPR